MVQMHLVTNQFNISVICKFGFILKVMCYDLIRYFYLPTHNSLKQERNFYASVILPVLVLNHTNIMFILDEKQHLAFFMRDNILSFSW